MINLRNNVRETLQLFFNKYLTSEMHVYDIGCGDKPFAKTLENKVKKYIGVDVEDGFYDSSNIDLIGTAYNVPINDEAADAVISSQVLEHLEHPEKAIEETSRILKNDGLLFLAFPFLYPIHAEPYDYSRITEYKIKKMLEQNNFEILEFKRVGGFWYLAGIFLCMYLQPIDCGILKRLKISTILLWLIRWLFFALHSLEGALLKMMNKEPEIFRNKWTSNYVLVAKKNIKKKA